MRILIVYSTKYKSTEKCAYTLKNNLKGTVDIVNIGSDNVGDISNYDLIIIGSPIRMGQVSKSVKKFCKEKIDGLKKKKIALFVCCGFSENAEQYFNTNFSLELLNNCIYKSSFGGELNVDKLKGFDKFITKMVAKASSKEGKNSSPEILTNNILAMAEFINS